MAEQLLFNITDIMAMILPLILIIYFIIKNKSWLKSSLFLIGGTILSLILGSGVDIFCSTIDTNISCGFTMLKFMQIGIIYIVLAIISAIIGLILKILRKKN